MSKPKIICLTIFVTLLVQALILQSWIVRTIVLDLIEPRPKDERAFVLTHAVELRDHEKKIGDLAEGQILYQPCRHDLHLTDPFDPRVLKLYVEFGGTTAWDEYATPVEDTPVKGNSRARLYLESRVLEAKQAEQAGSGQPATRPVVKPEGGDETQPEAEGRDR